MSRKSTPVASWLCSYNYLGGHVETPWAAPPTDAQWKSPQKLNDSTKVPILTELNAWTTGERRTWAPHGRSGPIIQYGDEGQGGMDAKQAGAVGGNACMMDGSISWKDIANMKYYQGSQIHLNGCQTMW